MPELPEVEAICRKLRRDALGSTIVRARMLRRRSRRLERRAAGQRIEEIERRGKNVLLHLGDSAVIRAHLRMTGNLYVIPDVRLRPVATRAYFELEGGRAIVFDDPRALGVVELLGPRDLEALLAELGPEPLSGDFTEELFIQSAQRSRKPAKLYLMDQACIAGLGNIYSAEALYRAGIHPTRPMSRLRRARLAALHAAILGVLEDAIQSACNAYSGPGKYNSDETFPVAVYSREGLPCRACGRRIRRIPQGGRSTYYCPGCQR